VLVGMSVVYQKGTMAGSEFVIERHNVDSLNWILERRVTNASDEVADFQYHKQFWLLGFVHAVTYSGSCQSFRKIVSYSNQFKSQ